MSGRYGMSASATATYEALREVDQPVTRAIASLLGAAQGTAPADRWQHCAEDIARAHKLLDQAAEHLAAARPDVPAEADDDAPTVVQSDSVYADPAVRAAVHAECRMPGGYSRATRTPRDLDPQDGTVWDLPSDHYDDGTEE